MQPPPNKGSQKYRKQRRSRTFKGRETAIEDQFEVAKLSLGKDDRWKSLSLGRELSMAGSISCDQVLEDTTVGSVRHCVLRVYVTSRSGIKNSRE
jgi:hypothetical protein